MGNPLFAPDKQPKPGGYALSVSMSNPLAGSFTFKGMQAGEYDSDIQAMFARFETQKPIILPEGDYSIEYFHTDQSQGGDEVDQPDVNTDIGKDIIFPKIAEVPLDIVPKQSKPEFTDEEKEILRKFPKNRQGKRAAMRRINHLREREEERTKPVTVPFDPPVHPPATYTRVYTRDADGNPQCEYVYPPTQDQPMFGVLW